MSRQVKLAIFYFSFCLFFSTATTITSHAHEQQSDVQVLIDESGFTPAVIHIEPHTTITFLNVGESVHLPASDAHPTHSHYSGTDLDAHCDLNFADNEVFDSCRGIGPGEAWSFTFEKTGEHTFHDHLWSHLGGTVYVQEVTQTDQRQLWERVLSNVIRFVYSLIDSSEAQQEPKLIESKQLDKIEYLAAKNQLRFDVEADGATTAIQNLIDLASNNEAIAAQCHDLLHEIGKEAFIKYGDFSKAIAHQTDYCNSGYIHGLFEAYFESKDGEILEIDGLCDNYSQTGRPFDSWQCYHGVGHGFMYQHGGDLTKALDSCDQLTTSQNINYCTNGVYMELFNNEILAGEPAFIDYSNPLTTCDNVTVGKSDCLFYAPSYFTQNMGYSHSETMELCHNLPLHLSHICIRGTAAEAAKRNQTNLSEVAYLCDFENALGKRDACLSGIVGITINQTASVAETVTACGDLPATYQTMCIATAESYRSFFEVQ